jgi:hypothetical protein
LITTEYQVTKGLAFMAEAVTDRVMAALAKLQAQVTGLMLIFQGIQRHQALNFAKEKSEYPLGLKTGLQLLAQLLTQLRKADGPLQKGWLLTKSQALQFRAIEVNCVGLGR